MIEKGSQAEAIANKRGQSDAFLARGLFYFLMGQPWEINKLMRPATMNQTNGTRVLLISNSTLYGSGNLDHAESEIRDFLGSISEVLFVQYALYDRAAYAAIASERFEKMGYGRRSVHSTTKAHQAVNDAEAVFIGGGNTFRLLKALYDADILQPIRERVAGGMLYIGSSAGSNVAGPTIKTTKDMPIVQPPSFDALDLVPFQISPHFLDPDPNSTYMGDTQEERILQFLEENATPSLVCGKARWLEQRTVRTF